MMRQLLKQRQAGIHLCREEGPGACMHATAPRGWRKSSTLGELSQRMRVDRTTGTVREADIAFRPFLLFGIHWYGWRSREVKDSENQHVLEASGAQAKEELPGPDLHPALCVGSPM
jgi:hypothetical protein